MDNEKQIPEETNSDSIEILVEYAWKVYEKHHQIFDNLDQKASYLTGFIGLFLTFSSGLLFPVLLQDYSAKSCFLVCIIVCFKLSIVALIACISISLFFSIYALKIRKITDIAPVSSVKEFLRNLEKEETPLKQTRKISIYVINSIEIATTSMQENCLYKSNQLKKSVLFLLLSLFFALINILLYMLIHNYGV
jgi:hypothetical protein